MTRDIETQVEQHYARSDLEDAVLEALAAAGKDIEHLQPDDLAPVDEFHSGGRQATAEFAAQLSLAPHLHILDIGCGIGGPSRFMARTYGCRVTGIDLAEDYVRTAASLARRVGLSEKVAYRQASALALPFTHGMFDGATMMHVGMNIADKAALFAEIRRVLKPGAAFGIYDIMRTGEGDMAFPLHWAASADTSFVVPPLAYRQALERAGFEVRHERDRRDFALQAFRQARERAAAGGPPPLGIHLLLKTDAGAKLANMIANLEAGRIAPVELIANAR